MEDELERLYIPVEQQLKRVRSKLLSLVRDQDDYLAQPLAHVSRISGKGIRPAITLLAAGFHPNDGHNAELMAGAVELLHVASLIHDDTVDESDIRRGIETVSSRWGRNSAVLVGDYVFATSATYVCDTGNVQVIRRFAETIMELSTGQLHEIANAFQPTQTRDVYLKRIYHKTASLFTTATESGAVLSGAPKPIVEALKQYGYNLGMAFQITDDILDIAATKEEIGKPVGADLSQGIMTLPAIIATEHAPTYSPIKNLFDNPSEPTNMRDAIEAIQDPSIIEQSFAVADRFSDKAIDALIEFENIPARESLEQLVLFVRNRRN